MCININVCNDIIININNVMCESNVCIINVKY